MRIRTGKRVHRVSSGAWSVEPSREQNTNNRFPQVLGERHDVRVVGACEVRTQPINRMNRWLRNDSVFELDGGMGLAESSEWTSK